MKFAPYLGFIALSGSGKTTLLEKLIPWLRKQGLRIALIKHAHHRFDIDIPGKDSYRLRHAGAEQVLIASQKRWALMYETPDNEQDPNLEGMLSQLDHTQLDLVLIEGFKHSPYPKILVYREAIGVPEAALNDREIIAVATDSASSPLRHIPSVDLNSIDQVGQLVVQWLEKQHT